MYLCMNECNYVGRYWCIECACTYEIPTPLSFLFCYCCKGQERILMYVCRYLCIGFVLCMCMIPTTCRLGRKSFTYKSGEDTNCRHYCHVKFAKIAHLPISWKAFWVFFFIFQKAWGQYCDVWYLSLCNFSDFTPKNFDGFCSAYKHQPQVYMLTIISTIV
jgi:hypothetical protein